MIRRMKEWLISIADLRRRLPECDGKRVAAAFRHGAMLAEIYAPRKYDPQTPHEQDEIYIISRGAGIFSKGGERRRFKAGDIIFVEAGAAHRFEEFTDDFESWVIFWGPPGGEKNKDNS